MRTVLFRAKRGSYKTFGWRQGTVPLMMVEGYQVGAAGPKITISELNLPLNPFGRDNELGN
jgi:hypothetical protein